VGASHKKKEPILREPEGTFAPQTSAAGGRLTRRFDLRYFKAAKQALTPDQFQKILQGLYGIALEDEDSLNRIAASSVSRIEVIIANTEPRIVVNAALRMPRMSAPSFATADTVS